MPPPPPASVKATHSSADAKFKPAPQLQGTADNSISNPVNDAYPPDRVQSVGISRRQMGPPPTPRLHTSTRSTQRFGFSPQDQSKASNQGQHPSTSRVQHHAPKSSARQGTSGFIHSTNTTSNQQELAHAPPTPVTSRRFNVPSNDPGSRSTSRATNHPPQSSRQAEQRIPFVSSGYG